MALAQGRLNVSGKYVTAKKLRNSLCASYEIWQPMTACGCEPLYGSQHARNLSYCKVRGFSIENGTITTTQRIKNLIGRMSKYNRAARSIGTTEWRHTQNNNMKSSLHLRFLTITRSQFIFSLFTPTLFLIVAWCAKISYCQQNEIRAQ